jgi:hypothetical protein
MKQRIKDHVSRLRKKNEPETTGRITNETVAEHREQILAGGRRFKYPVQYARVRLIRNTIILTLAAVVALGGLTYWQLYPAQTTNKFFYRITQLLAFPVAKIENENVPYSYYLLELRSSIHFLSGKNTNFNTDDGKRQLLYQKRLALNKALETTYAYRLARENGISVADKEVDEFIQKTLTENRLSTNQEVYSRAINDYYGWEFDEFKTSLRAKLLKRKVVQAIDKPAQEEANTLLKQLQGGADFAALAKASSDDPGADQAGGDVGFVPRNTQDPNGLVDAAAKLAPNQISGVLAGTDGLYIIKVLETNPSEIHYSRIFVAYQEFEKRLADIKKRGAIQEYISVPQDTAPVKQE